MMTDNKMTPEQLVREWLPEYERRYDEHYQDAVRTNGRSWAGESENSARRLRFAMLNFPEALEAFARHVWDQACREQRGMCAQAYTDYNGEDFDHETVSEAICSAPAPEFKIPEKE